MRILNLKLNILFIRLQSLLNAMKLLKTEIGRLRLLAFAEGVSFLMILFISMPLKYLLDLPGPNQVIGLLHGILFVLYVLALIPVIIKYRWNLKTSFFSFLAAFIPFGTFWADAKIFRKVASSE